MAPTPTSTFKVKANDYEDEDEWDEASKFQTSPTVGGRPVVPLPPIVSILCFFLYCGVYFETPTFIEQALNDGFKQCDLLVY